MKPSKKPVHLSHVFYPFALGKDLRVDLKRLTDQMTEEVVGIARDDDYPFYDRANRLMTVMERYKAQYEEIAASTVPSLSNSVYEEVKRLFNDSISKATGRIFNIPYSEREQTKHAIETMSYYVSFMPDEFMDRIATVLLREQTGKRHTEDMTFVQALNDASRGYKKNVTGKVKNVITHITANATQDIAIALDIDRYEWRTMLDERVVGNPAGRYPHGNSDHGNHWERHGKIFRFSNPPSDGNPGEAINCRCVAVPMM